MVIKGESHEAISGVMMPTLLNDFKEHDPNLYNMATTFQMQFFIHFMVDVLHEMNLLSKKFEKDYVDITNVANALDVVIEVPQKWYFGSPFGYGSNNYRSS